jgi:hypothetical protein
MSQLQEKSADIAERGQAFYDAHLRQQVETEDNIGKIIVLDVDSGDYEIAEEGLTAGHRLKARRPDASMLCLRIGYNAVYSFGGVLTRTKQ